MSSVLWKIKDLKISVRYEECPKIIVVSLPHNFGYKNVTKNIDAFFVNCNSKTFFFIYNTNSVTNVCKVASENVINQIMVINRRINNIKFYQIY